MPTRRAVIWCSALVILIGTVGPVAPLALAQDGTPAATCPAATPEENLAVVQRFFAGVNSADLSVFAEVVTPEVIYDGATVGDESGLEALQRTYGEALTGFADLQYDLLSSVASAEAVAVRYHAHGTHTGDFRGLQPTGKPISWFHSAFARVECGRITEMWAEIDQLDRLHQFGLLAEEGPAAIMVGAGATLATPVSAGDAGQCAPQSPEELIAITDRVREEVYGGDLEVMPELFAADYVHGSANGPDALGIEEGKRRIAGFVTALPDLDWTFDEVVVDDNRLAARWTTRGTHDGDLLGFPATGKPVEFTGISHFTFDCGKIVEFQTEMDVAGLLEQIGAPVRREAPAS